MEGLLTVIVISMSGSPLQSGPKDSTLCLIAIRRVVCQFGVENCGSPRERDNDGKEKAKLTFALSPLQTLAHGDPGHTSSAEALHRSSCPALRSPAQNFAAAAAAVVIRIRHHHVVRPGSAARDGLPGGASEQGTASDQERRLDSGVRLPVSPRMVGSSPPAFRRSVGPARM